MEETPLQSTAKAGTTVPPSVAQLAGRFQEQAAVKETPASKPTRRKPPCSLPLFPPKLELGQNGEEKSSSSGNHGPKVKVKSSPLIEKLQASLAFDPAALLPGASPKSPGLKAVVSPFQSPPSTPSSPGVSFDQPPPEGSQLPCFNKVRTRGSIKRRPPSRRFRRSQSDCGDLADFRVPEPSQENGDVEFPAKASEKPECREGQENCGSLETLPLRRTPSRTEKKSAVPEETQHPQPAMGAPEKEPEETPQLPSSEAGSGIGGPGTAEVQEDEAKDAKEGVVPQKCQEEGGTQEKVPSNPPEGGEDGPSPEQGGNEEKGEEEMTLELGLSNGQQEAGGEAPDTEDHSPAEDTEM